MKLRDFLGLRFLKRRYRVILRVHTARIESLFEAFEADGDDPEVLLNSALEDLRGGSALVALSPGRLSSAVIAAMGILRRIPFQDDRSVARLHSPAGYRRHFVAERVLAYAEPLRPPFSAREVALLFELALLSGNPDESLRKIEIRAGDEWPAFAATHLTDQILADVRPRLFSVAISAADGLMSFEVDGEVTRQLTRARNRLMQAKPQTYEVYEALDRIDTLLARGTDDDAGH